MTKSTKKSQKSPLYQAFPYILAAAAVLGLVFYGSLDKTSDLESNMNMESIAADNFNVSADQISQFFMVSELASSLSLPTAEAVNVNYNSLSVMRDNGQTSVEKLEKPDIVDISDVVCDENYTVKSGETLDSIAAHCGVTTTQLRWSNGLKTDDISEGAQLKIPSVPGIVYTVKSGENAGSIASKYSSDTETIIAHNCPTTTDCIAEGMTITIPSGELPETERPEYVAPSYSYSYSSASTAATRTYSTSVNQMPWGWCTWFAWQWRYDNMGDGYSLPGGLGNASTWANSLRGSYNVDKTPAYGAVFVSYAGYYGHVGIVTGVDGDTITITDMNGQAGWGRVGTRTVERNEWSSWQFIHGKK